PTEWFSSDVFDSKKKLKGERQAVFPEGVPGATTGVPADLVKGYQPPPEQPESNDAVVAGPKPPPSVTGTGKPKPKPKPKTNMPNTKPGHPTHPAAANQRRSEPGGRTAPRPRTTGLAGAAAASRANANRLAGATAGANRAGTASATFAVDLARSAAA